MQNRFSFQTQFKFLKSVHWLSKYSIWRWEDITMHVGNIMRPLKGFVWGDKICSFYTENSNTLIDPYSQGTHDTFPQA